MEKQRKKVLLAAVLLLAVTHVFAQGDGSAGITEATQMVTSYFGPATQLIYAIGAVVGLSVQCDFDRYPYTVRTYARQYIIRSSNVTRRSLVTSCLLVNSVRSDENPQGFTMEQFRVVENKDVEVLER
jgi:Domain of unknown function (DUF4134)